MSIGKTWSVVSSFDPMLDKKLHVYVVYGKLVHISNTPEYQVSLPNFIERMLGITFKDKIDAAKRKCQKWCDERNAYVESIEAQLKAECGGDT